MARKDDRPTAINKAFPIYIPSPSGETQIEVGSGRLRYGTLVIEFRDTAASVAIQRMIERDVLLGMAFVMLAPDEKNIRAQEQLKAEEDARAAENAEKPLVVDDIPSDDDLPFVREEAPVEAEPTLDITLETHTQEPIQLDEEEYKENN